MSDDDFEAQRLAHEAERERLDLIRERDEARALLVRAYHLLGDARSASTDPGLRSAWSRERRAVRDRVIEAGLGS